MSIASIPFCTYMPCYHSLINRQLSATNADGDNYLLQGTRHTHHRLISHLSGGKQMLQLEHRLPIFSSNYAYAIKLVCTQERGGGGGGGGGERKV